jgi:hypothetical protein
MRNASASWAQLVSGGAAVVSENRFFYLLQRQGHELLAIPAASASSPDVLALYLPQTAKARLAKHLFRLTLSSPLAGLLPTLEVPVQRTEFTDFLCSLSGGCIPPFAVLSGNPAVLGRRFIFGLLDPQGKCRTIVKCAIDNAGGHLIEAEAAALKTLNGKFPAIPELRANLATAECRAFAMDFFAESGRLLTREERITQAKQWICPGAAVPLRSLVPWQAIAHPSLSTVGAMVHPVVFHGDFAPWNIRRSGNQWMVIDWEKASPHGPPLWDLLHYEIHEEILVNRSTAEKVRGRIQSLLQDPSLQNYLADCGASEHSQLLLQGYLSHLDTIYPNIRGRKTVDELIASYRS